METSYSICPDCGGLCVAPPFELYQCLVCGRESEGVELSPNASAAVSVELEVFDDITEVNIDPHWGEL
jgi:DNA-directed RNA polymerase subunit RPC12/RpoP